MNDLEYQEYISQMTIPELIDTITGLTEAYNENLTILTQEILIRLMEQAE